MAFLRKKIKKGIPYWYVVQKKRVGKKVIDDWQIYLGTAERIVEKFQNVGPTESIKLKSYQLGKLALILSIDKELGFTKAVNEQTGKKKVEGLTVGDYLLITIFGRWCGPLSKKATAEHFTQSFLKFHYNIPHKMNAQNILNNMKYIKDRETINAISDEMSIKLMSKGIVPSTLYLDTTNFSTNIETIEDLLRKGKAKDKQFGKNLVGLGLVINEENIPFIHETYPGNEHDANILPILVDRITKRLKSLKVDPKSVTVVMDKGNNSEDNLNMIKKEMHVVGSLKKSQVRELMGVPLGKFAHLYTNEKKHEIKGYRVKLPVFDQEFTVVVSHNPATEKRQKKTYEKAKEKFLNSMAKLKHRYERTKGKGRKMTQSGAINNTSKIVHKQYQSIFKFEIHSNPKKLEYWVSEEKELEWYAGFGKNAIFTDMHDWTSEQIAKTYNSKYKVEDDFKWLNNKLLIPITPMYVRKDDSIRVHVFLCVVGLLFYRYFIWKMKYLQISDSALLKALEGIRVALVSNKEKMNRAKLVVEEMDYTQSQIFCKFDMGQCLKGY